MEAETAACLSQSCQHPNNLIHAGTIRTVQHCVGTCQSLVKWYDSMGQSTKAHFAGTI